MADPDPQFKTLRDALTRLSPSERLKNVQSLFSALNPSEQMTAFQETLGRAFVPGEQVQAMRDLVTTFSPSADQLATIGKQLEAQRAQLEMMITQLDDLEGTLARLTETAEQLRTMQEPFLKFASSFFPRSHDPKAGSDD